MTENNRFIKGLTEGLPIGIGYLSVSFAFGIFAVSSGLTVWEALLISMTNLTSAGQLAAVPIISGGGTLMELVLSQLVINARYALMSVSLSQKLGESVPLSARFLIAFGNTDEVFAVASTQPGLVGRRYMYGLIVMPFVGWTAGTALGAVAGHILPHLVISSLGIAIYGMFIAIVVPPMKQERSVAGCVGLAVALSCLFYYVPGLASVPSGFVIILCAVTAAAVMALVAPISELPEEEQEVTERA